MADTMTAAESLEQIGIARTPDKDSWLGIHATRIVEAVKRHIDGTTEDDDLYIYGMAARLIENQLLRLVETGQAIDTADAEQVMEAADENLDRFIEAASTLTVQYVSAEDDEDDDDNAFEDENTLPIQLLDWVEAALNLQSAAIAMFEWEVGEADDDDAWGIVATATAMLAVISDRKIEGSVLHAPVAGIELVLRTLLETSDVVYEEEIPFKGMGVDDSGFLLLQCASKFEEILGEGNSDGANE